MQSVLRVRIAIALKAGLHQVFDDGVFGAVQVEARQRCMTRAGYLQVGIILTENCWDCRRKNLRRIIIAAAAVARLPNYLQFLRAFERRELAETSSLNSSFFCTHC